MTAATISDLLQSSAVRFGDRPALVMGNDALTYRTFEDAANRFACSLIRYGIRPGDRVALWAPKSIEAIVAVWGVMKAGAAYVPIDVAAPAQRVMVILRDCAAGGLITTKSRATELGMITGRFEPLRAIWLSEPAADAPPLRGSPVVTWGEVEGESAAAPGIRVESDACASIHYTSGSTGRPKGVAVAHRALLEQVWWTQEFLQFSPDDRLPGHTPLHGAMSTFELFVTVNAGATLFPVAPRLALFPRQVAKSWSEQRLTALFAVPGVFVGMLQQDAFAAFDFSSVRLIGFGGERFPVERLRELMKLMPRVRFVNWFGCSEAKIRAFHELKSPIEESDTRRLGKVSSRCALHVLDDDDRPVSAGAIGKLWVSGPVLMQGYWGLPELTAQVLREIGTSPAERVLAYCTGDLAKYRPDGGLELIGRADRQVKIRGYRVELGEVEVALYGCPDVEFAMVTAVPDQAGGVSLKAIVKLKGGATTDAEEVKRVCANALPPHMLPKTIELRATLPRLSNGKVDRRALC